MRHGSLFSGIGGFDLAATWMGWENVFSCERDRFCRRVLQHYWPKTICYDDVKSLDARTYCGRIEVISGGFPCQPFSNAGKRKGVADDRYLWPQMLRIVGEVQPRWVVGENVFGLVSWNGGMVFRKVLTELESAGYDVWPYVLSACAVGAPHRRSRIFFIACKKGAFEGKFATPYTRAEFFRSMQADESRDRDTSDQITANTDRNKRRQGGMHPPRSSSSERYPSTRYARTTGNAWQDFPSQSPVCSGNDGVPTGLDGITFSKWRAESIKAYGNAIVPQVALNIFRVIESIETGNLSC